MVLSDLLTGENDQYINIDRCLGVLELENDFSIIESYTQNTLCQPSESLSKKLGYDIHENWKFPYPHWKHEDVELLVFAAYFDIHAIQELFNMLAEHNPEMYDLLACSNIDGERYKMMSIIHGMTSKFNFDDIKEYIEGGYAYVKRQDQEWDRKTAEIEKIYGHIEYVMSYKTLDTVYNKLSN